MGVSVEALLAEAQDDEERDRLLAAGDKISGAWLYASPISSMEFRMDDSCLRIVVGLHLGTSICAPHICQHCGVVPRCLHSFYMFSAVGLVRVGI